MKTIILAIGLFSLALMAQEVLPFENESQRQLYQELTAELRCPQCQNQNIADSNAIVAVDMRQKTYELVQQGKSRQQVLDYMINRYGDFVHYQPPVNRFTVWLWLLPALMLLGLLIVGLLRRRQQTRIEPTTVQLDETELDQLIDRYRSKKP
ncbi:MAG TPA: cytochrome c-type biogenesis protein [Rheinheimera sp.]|nr:cytochrome c-type biogenesis protein [Rheinheimera sp.]